MEEIQGRKAITMATSRTERMSNYFRAMVSDLGLPMMGMTVQAVRVLLATAMIESSSSNRVTSPSSLSFSALNKYCNWKYFGHNYCKECPVSQYLDVEQLLLDLEETSNLLLRLRQALLQLTGAGTNSCIVRRHENSSTFRQSPSGLVSPRLRPSLLEGRRLSSSRLQAYNLHLLIFALALVKICTLWSTCDILVINLHNLKDLSPVYVLL